MKRLSHAWGAFARRSVLILCLALGLLFPGQGAPASPDAPSAEEGSEAANLLSRLSPTPTANPWRIVADRVEASHDAEIVEAEGRVMLWQDDQYLKADFARYFISTGWVYLRGNVEAQWRGDLLEAEEGEFDLNSQVGWVRNGRITVAEPHLYFSGDYIRKTEGQTYSFKNARVTACDGEKPAWAVSAREGEINLDGRARLYHISFLVKNTPAFYAPFVSAPAKNSRLSGFLPPETTVSTRLGAQLNIPYYYVIDAERDVTLYENYMLKRGFMQGLEYRHAEDAQTKGLWRLDWLRDNMVAESESQETSDLNSDGLIRPNSNRWWLRSKLDSHLWAPDLDLKVDLDIVSDQNYLRDFTRGLNGFNRSRAEFRNEFRRDLEENDDLTRTSTVLAGKSQDWFGLYGRVDYVENLAYRNDNLSGDRNPTVQRLPRLEGYVFKNALPGLPVEFEADNSLTYYWRRYGTRAGVLDAHPRLSLPFSLGPLSLVPGFGLRETLYGVESYQNETDPEVGGSKSLTRSIPEASVTAFAEYFRVFDLDAPPTPGPETAGQGAWTRVKHAIQPRLDYEYVSSAQQSRYPRFDERIDRIEPVQELTYSLTNILVRRRDFVAAPAGEKASRSVERAAPDRNSEPGGQAADQAGGQAWTLARNYLRFLELRLEQSYDFREAERDESRETYPRRPFSDLLTDLVVRFDERLSLVNRTFWSPYLSRVTEHEHYLEYVQPDLGRAHFGLDYIEPIDEFNRRITENYSIIRVGGQARLTPVWNVGLDYRFDYEEQREIEKEVFLDYLDQCYSVRMIFNQSPGDDRFEVRVDLLGLSIF